MGQRGEQEEVKLIRGNRNVSTYVDFYKDGNVRHRIHIPFLVARILRLTVKKGA